MDDENENGGLFNIEISSEDEEAASIKAEKLPRDFQSEADFQKVKEEYRAKVEVGDLWKTLNLPIDNPSKPESQLILHAVEELYFFRRYEQARDVTEMALKGVLMEEFRGTLEDYRERCMAKIKGGEKEEKKP